MKHETQVKLHNAAEKMSKTQMSWKFVAVLSTILLGLSFIQMLSFGIDGENSTLVSLVSSNVFPDLNPVILTWMTLSFSAISAVPGIIAGILMAQRKRNAIWYFIAAGIPFMINDIILGLWFDLIKLTAILLLITKSYVQWNKVEGLTEPKIKAYSTPQFIVVVASLISIAAILGLTMDFAMMQNGLLPAPNARWMIYADAFILTNAMFAFFMISHHYKAAYHLFYLGNITSIILFAANGIIVTSMAFVLYMVVDIGGALTWSSKWHKQQEG